MRSYPNVRNKNLLNSFTLIIISSQLLYFQEKWLWHDHVVHQSVLPNQTWLCSYQFQSVPFGMLSLIVSQWVIALHMVITWPSYNDLEIQWINNNWVLLEDLKIQVLYHIPGKKHLLWSLRQKYCLKLIFLPNHLTISCIYFATKTTSHSTQHSLWYIKQKWNQNNKMGVS